MFSDSQQLVVDPKAGRIGIGQHQVLSATKPPDNLVSREKSFSYAFVQSLDESVSSAYLGYQWYKLKIDVLSVGLSCCNYFLL